MLSEDQTVFAIKEMGESYNTSTDGQSFIYIKFFFKHPF